MRVVVVAGDGDEPELKLDDGGKMQEIRLEESVLGELRREKAWKKCVVAKSGAGRKATS